MTLFIIGMIAAFFVYLLPAYAMSISARISDRYTEVAGGDRLYFEVEIKYPENPRRKDLRLEYQIIENGEIVATEKVLRAIETQVSFLDYIVVPQSVGSGIKELKVIIEDYETLHKEVSASFKVLKSGNQVERYFFIILGAILLVAILVIIQIMINRRQFVRIR